MRIVILKDVFTSEDLGTNVTSRECRRLQDSSTAVDVRNAMFGSPYGRHDIFNARCYSEQCTQSQNSTTEPHRGINVYKCKKTYQFKTQCKDDMVISDI